MDDIAGDLDGIKCLNIQKHVNSLMEEMDLQERIHDLLESTLASNKELHEEDKHDILTKVETQHESLKEVLSYTEYLLGVVKRVKHNLEKETFLRSSLAEKNGQLRCSLGKLSIDAKHDKEFIKAL